MSKKNDDTREIPADELEFGANDTRLRGLPASFADSNDDQTFTLNELEGDIDRSLGPSSDYKQRSVQVTSNYDQEDGLSFVDTFSHQKQYVDTSSASFSSGTFSSPYNRFKKLALILVRIVWFINFFFLFSFFFRLPFFLFFSFLSNLNYIIQHLWIM